MLFHVEKPKESAYKIEGLEIASASTASSGSEAKVVEAVDIKALLGMIIGVVTVASIWFNLTAEIEMLKIKVSKMDEKVQSNYRWVNSFEPPKEVQKAVDEINVMKLENAVTKYKVEQLLKNKK